MRQKMIFHKKYLRSKRSGENNHTLGHSCFFRAVWLLSFSAIYVGGTAGVTTRPTRRAPIAAKLGGGDGKKANE
jgi:hypothetical protein